MVLQRRHPARRHQRVLCPGQRSERAGRRLSAGRFQFGRVCLQHRCPSDSHRPEPNPSCDFTNPRPMDQRSDAAGSVEFCRHGRDRVSGQPGDSGCFIRPGPCVRRTYLHRGFRRKSDDHSDPRPRPDWHLLHHDHGGRSGGSLREHQLRPHHHCGPTPHGGFPDHRAALRTLLL